VATEGGQNHFEQLVRDALNKLRNIKGSCACKKCERYTTVSFGDTPPHYSLYVQQKRSDPNRQFVVLYCEDCMGLIAAMITDEMLAYAPELKRFQLEPQKTPSSG
jgi:hypothetical protein